MEALVILGVVVVVAISAAFCEPWFKRVQARRDEDRRLEAVFAVLRLYGETPPRRRGQRRR